MFSYLLKPCIEIWHKKQIMAIENPQNYFFLNF
jgi:hypothetical protein